MKGVNGFTNEGFTIMTLMRMTFGEFDVSCNASLLINIIHFHNYVYSKPSHFHTTAKMQHINGEILTECRKLVT